MRDRTLEVDMVGWVAQAIEFRDARIRHNQEQQRLQQLSEPVDQQ